MIFGNTAGSVGQQGTNTGNVAVGNQLNKGLENIFGQTLGNHGKLGTIAWNINGASHGIKGNGINLGNAVSSIGQQ